MARKTPHKNKARKPLTAQQRAQRVLSELRSLGRQLAEEQGLHASEVMPIEELVLPARVAFSGNQKEGTEALLAAYRERIAESVTARLSFRRGHVYCFQCGSNDCAHARPGTSEETFAGYTATGKPAWISLPNLCIARGDPRVDKLYGGKPEVVTVIQPAHELTEELLPSFGRDSLAFKLIGQVVAGWIPGRVWPASRDSERVALTVQVVETLSSHPRSRLRVNVLGLGPNGLAEAAHESARMPAERLRRAVRETRERVEAIGRRMVEAERRGKPLEVGRESATLLKKLGHELSRIFNSGDKRTRHAQSRHVKGGRPTSSALRDAREAPDERLLRDTRRDTIVVLGPRGRAHLFSPEGKHVTSLQLDPGELDRKSRKGRWVPMAIEDARAWRGELGGEDGQEG